MTVDMNNQPLAERMRPKTIDELVGQEQLLGSQGVIRKFIEHEHLPSFILWGPPGTGKTTIAGIIAHQLDRPFFSLSAINSGVKDVRETIRQAENKRFFSAPNPVLFIDEIHRFSKSQQDSLLNAVEKGIITLIGATTENPSFEVIPALLSRCQVYVLDPLSKDDLIRLINRAINQDEVLKRRTIEVKSYNALLRISGGDARRLLNSLEIIANALDGDHIAIDDEVVKEIIQKTPAHFDKGGEMHYDVISAFIKSIRGSDPNAAVYYLARMIEGGEDAKFICRRMIILAAEDIGLANPNALLMAESAFRSIEKIGMPEGRIIMSQVAIYLASSPKSNTAYLAIGSAQQLVRQSGDLSVPLALRNAPTRLMKDLGYGAGYAYAHDAPGNFAEMEFLPNEITGQRIYNPGENPAENKIRLSLRQKWKEKYGY